MIDRKRIPKLLAALAAVLLIGMSTIFAVNRTISRKRIVGACYMTMNNQFYEVLNNEVRKVVESHGDDLVVYDPQMNLEKQIEQIEYLIDQDVAGIIVNPIDSKALAP